jgi:hypothetical protein
MGERVDISKTIRKRERESEIHGNKQQIQLFTVKIRENKLGKIK